MAPSPYPRVKYGTFDLARVSKPTAIIRSAASPESAVRAPLLWIAALAFAARAAVRWYRGEADFWEHGYTFFFALAQSIAAGNGVSLDGVQPTAFRVPLYPMFLAAVTFGHHAFVPVLLAQSLVGAGTVLCAGLIARELFGGTSAIIAAMLTAIYPYYVVHDTALQETSLYTFLMVLAVLLLLRVRRSASFLAAAAAGLALGAAVLTRANLAPFALVAPLWLALAAGPDAAPWRPRLRVAVVCAAVAMSAGAPWLVRAYQLTGSATLSTQNGFFLWLGNNPHTFSRYPQESIDRSQAVALEALSSQEQSELAARRRNEAAADAWFRQKGLDYIHEHPWRTLRNAVYKIADAFGWMPSPRRGFWPSLAHALSYGPVMLLGLWGMWANRRHWREHSIFYAQFVCFAAVTGVYFGHTSYRAYLDVYWIVFAAATMASYFSRYPPSRCQKRNHLPLVQPCRRLLRARSGANIWQVVSPLSSSTRCMPPSRQRQPLQRIEELQQFRQRHGQHVGRIGHIDAQFGQPIAPAASEKEG
jgi:4-amino-4-deoxy-L-arabinose transferase-like glycosyltransferase